MKQSILIFIILIICLQINAQNIWLHIEYSWAQDDTRLFQLRHRFASKIIYHEKKDQDYGTYEYSIGVRKKMAMYLLKKKVGNIAFGIGYTNEVQTYTKYIHSGYFTKSDVGLSISDPTFHKYYIKQIVFPIELTINRKNKNAMFYMGISTKTSFSFEKKVLGTWGFIESNNLYLRRKFQFYKVSLNPKIGFVKRRFDIALFWRWKQFSVFDTAIYHFSNYASSNAKAQHEFGDMKYEWFNLFKIGMSLRYRL